MRTQTDNAFQGHVTVFDADAVQQLITEYMTRVRSEWYVAHIRIVDVKYDSDESCVLLYSVKFKHVHTKRSRKEYVTVQALHDTDTLPVADENQRRCDTKVSVFPDPVIVFEAFRVVIYAFPHDVQLPWLNAAVDVQHMKDAFNKLWIYKKRKVKRIDIDVLGYTPRMRASLVYRLDVEDKQTGAREAIDVIAKMNAFKSADNLFANAHVTWEAGAGSIGFARPMGFMHSPRVTLQERIPGVRLGSLVDAPNIHEIIRDTAHALARLHALKVPIRRTRKLKEEVRVVERWRDMLISICPHLRERLETLSKTLVAEVTSRHAIAAPVHADFHHTNVLVDKGTVRIIDLDEMAMGDPCLDVGRFMASLRIPSLRVYGNMHALDDLRDLFLSEYQTVRDINVASVRVYEAISLLVSSGSAFRLQRPAWEDEVALLVAESERMLDKAMCETGTLQQTVSGPILSVDERRLWANDPVYMQTVLCAPMHELYGFDMVVCKNIKQSSRGWRLRYECVGWKGREQQKIYVDGFLLKNADRKHYFDSYRRMRRELRALDESVYLPRTIGYIRDIAMVVVENSRSKKITGVSSGKLFGTFYELAKHCSAVLDDIKRSVGCGRGALIDAISRDAHAVSRVDIAQEKKE